MNERSRKMKGLSRRLMAWLLCCVFLVAASPVSATTAEDATPAASETVIEQQTEATTAEPVTSSIAETTTQSVSIDNTSADAGSSEAATSEATSATESVAETEKDTAQTLYERIMACTTYAEYEEIMSSLTDEEMAQMDSFTDEQNAALTAKMDALGGYTTETAADWWDNWNKNYTFTVTPNLDNVEAVYFAYHSSSDVTSNIQFTPVTSGTVVSIEDFSKNQAGYILFFVKPTDNYLLTAVDATGNGDIYSVDGTLTNIGTYPHIADIVKQAKALGYVGVLGYSRASGDTRDMSHTITLTGKSPDIAVAATPDKTQGVKPNDKLTFTITVTPGVIANATVSGVEVVSLTINDQVISGVTLTKGADGKYTAKVEYIATEDDCESGSVDLNITAKVSYDGALGVSDGQSLTSDAYIKKSASTTCAIADKNTVEYVLKYENADGITEYPEAIKESGKPEDITGVYSGTTVNVDTTYGKSEVDDPTNHGTWTFDGWYKGNDKVTSFTMGDSHVKLKGTWTFTPYPNADLTITKTLSGNMYDSSAKFTFKVTYTKDGETKTETVELEKDETSGAISIPVGATVTITEDSKGYVLSVKEAKSGDSNLEYTKIDFGITFTMPSDAVSVVIDNSKNVTVDTGVILDTLPYILILAVVVIGGVLLISRRRNHDRA